MSIEDVYDKKTKNISMKLNPFMILRLKTHLKFELWAQQHYLPYASAEKFTSQRTSEVFKVVDEASIQHYFDYRMNQTKANESCWILLECL